MTYLDAPALFLIISTMLDCPPVPILDQEKSQIAEAAKEARPAELANAEFESISITKCEIRYELDEVEPEKVRLEYVNLYGVFPHTVRNDTYRERWSIRCHKHSGA